MKNVEKIEATTTETKKTSKPRGRPPGSKNKKVAAKQEVAPQTQQATQSSADDIKPYSKKNSPAYWQGKLTEMYNNPQFSWNPEELSVRVQQAIYQHPSYLVLQDKEKERVLGFQDCLREELYRKLNWFQVTRMLDNRPAAGLFGQMQPPPAESHRIPHRSRHSNN